jgi:hypothetical protein
LRASLLYLAWGFTLGGLLLWDKGMPLGPPIRLLTPLHVEVALVGWVLELVMGTAYWIFPRFGMTPAQRGREDLAWLAFGLVNVGLWLVGLTTLLELSPTVATAGRAFEALAATLMAANIWARTRASGLSPM